MALFDSGGQPIPIAAPWVIPGWIVINVTPGDTRYNIELTRSPDNGSGGADLANEVLVQTYLAPIPAGGFQYQEQCSADGVYRHYRARHVRSDVTPGAYTADLRVIPVLQVSDIIGPMPPPAFSTLTPFPLPAATTVASPAAPSNYIVASAPNPLPTLPNVAYPLNIFVKNAVDGNTYQNQSNVWVRVGITPPSGSEFIQIVGVLPTLPSGSYPQGAVVYLTTDNKLYRSTGSTWTTAVDSSDLTANSVTTNAILAGAVTAAKISVTQLSAISTDTGLLKAGALQDAFSPSTLYEIRMSAAACPDPDTVDALQSYIDFAASTNFMRVGQAPKAIVSSTNANPSVITVTAHGLVTGNFVTIRGHTTNTAINGSGWPVTRIDNDTFSVPVLGNGNGGATGHIVRLTLVIVGGSDPISAGSVNVYGNITADSLTAIGSAEFKGGLRSTGGGALFRTLQHSSIGEYGDPTIPCVLMDSDALLLLGDAGPSALGTPNPGAVVESVRIGSYSVSVAAPTARSSGDVGLAAGSKGWTDPDGSDNGVNTLSFTGNANSTVAAASRLWQKLGDSPTTEGVNVDAYDDNYKIGFKVNANYTSGGNPNAVVTATVQVEYSTDASFATWTTLAPKYIVHAGGVSSGWASSGSAAFTPTVVVPGVVSHVGFRLLLNVVTSILDSTYHSGAADGSVQCFSGAYRSSNYVTTWTTSTSAVQYRRGLKLAKVHQPQQLLNRDLESGLVYWAQTAGTAVVVTDATKAHGGSKYMQITTSGAAAGNAVATYISGGKKFFPVTPGDVITFGGWAYRESGTSSVRYLLETYDASQVLVVSNPGTSQNTAAWVQVSDSYTIPASGVSYVALYMDVTAVATTVARFDDASLIIGSGDLPHVYLEPVDTIAADVDGLEGELQFVGGTTHGLAYKDDEKMRYIAKVLIVDGNKSITNVAPYQSISAVTIKAQRMNVLGRGLRIRATGRIGANTGTITMKIGGTDFSAIALTSGQSWEFDHTIYTAAIGASGTLSVGGRKGQATTYTADEGNMTQDLTADFLIDMRGFTVGGVALTLRTFIVEWIN